MKLTERELLYEQYKVMSDDKLKEIINDNSYDVLAKEVAKEILNSDRSYYYQQQDNIKQEEQKREKNKQAKISAQQTNPLYDDIHQIAKDVRFIKNIFAIAIILSAISTLLTLILFLIDSAIGL